jgi:kynurenine formamidase
VIDLSVPLDAATQTYPGDPCHLLVAAIGGIVVENLTNLEAVDFGEPLISVLPLRLTGADGGPTRAVAIDLSH